MYSGDKAMITMIHNLKENEETDKRVIKCTVIEYKKETEEIHLLVETGELRGLSLDAVYECRIQTLQGESICTGMIKERYENRAGMIIVLRVINGFYEINIK